MLDLVMTACTGKLFRIPGQVNARHGAMCRFRFHKPDLR